MFAPTFIAKSPLQDAGSTNSQQNNCQDWVPNGNCGSPTWDMPDGNWWAYPFGTTRLNPSGFDFSGGHGDFPNCGGGSSTVDTALTTFNSKANLGTAVNKFGVHSRSVVSLKNCNCGPTGTPAAGNCYSNCNCDSACNCNCNCNCDCRC